GFLLRSLIMFQTFISRHNSNFFSDKLVLTSVTPASSAPVLQTPKATSSTLYFDSLTVNAGNGGFLHCIQMDTSVNAANQVVSFAIQRLMNAMRQAHADGWFIVFDTLTLADDRLEAFYDNPNALRDYFRDIGRMVLAAEGRKANDSH